VAGWWLLLAAADAAASSSSEPQPAAARSSQLLLAAASAARGGRLRQDSKRDITKKRNKFKFSYSRRAREISAFVARIVVLYKLKMQYHAHPSAMPMWYNVREDGA